MKLLNFLSHQSTAGFIEVTNRSSRRSIYMAIAVVTFFMVITAQFFWATIHGDGAVYAWLTRQVTENGIFSNKLPAWSQTEIFADHPYLFFYISSLLTRFLGFSDLVMKIPNFIVAALSIWTVYRVVCVRDGDQSRSYQIGLTAGYALLLNAAYGLQISEPTLDPLAQFLGLAAVLILIYRHQAFGAGFVLGLAFLTKGLEMLPNLAALFFLACYLNFRNPQKVVRQLILGLFGLALPIAAWLGYDFYIWKSQWLQTYVTRQFQNRLLSDSNMQSFLGFDYVWTFLRVYFFEMLIIILGLIKSVQKKRQNDALFFYFICYVFFHVLAFMIIKKDSSQHLTGVLLVGSIFVGEYIWEAFQKLNRSVLRVLPILLLIPATVYWSYYIFKKNDKPDLWTSIRNEAAFFAENEAGVPLVVKNSSHDLYGLFNTAQWYFSKHKVYLQNEADQSLVGQEVILLSDGDGHTLVKTKVIYQKDAP